ncbi:cytochrome b [Halomonas sp. IOP_31]|uniref:cytochrome b n=1 Tax=Halomonas sp. IOP_31 TaxID=2876584 RepID=UPI001E55E6B1|nr:cytochrome b/b6 domain-containing protein [Halomonas sp. IOP_31]MCD6009821.1 cytochrome b/b6 domain-containing protein [Halomonas sp. IOP_31]
MSDRERYSPVSIINHWVTALLVVVMLALGYAAYAAPSGTVRNYILGIHISLGFFVLIFIFWRVLFRLYKGFPENLGKTAIERWTAYVVHRALLILLVFQVLTGPLYLFSVGECVGVFGWFSVCLPLKIPTTIYQTMGWIHIYNGMYIIPALLILHFLGAIRHYASRKTQETPADM